MDASKFLSWKRDESCRQTNMIRDEFCGTDDNTSSAFFGRKRGRVITYQFTFCLGVLLVQLARVHSWSPSISSAIAKKSTLSAATLGNKEYGLDYDLGTSDKDRQTIPTSELLSSRHLILDKKNCCTVKMEMSSSFSSQPITPSMLLGNDIVIPLGTNSLAASRATAASIYNSMKGCDKASIGGLSTNQEGRVLGFELNANNPKSSSNEELQVTWNNDRKISSISRDLTRSMGASSSINNKGGVRLETMLPAWFPWIPTKSQIRTLKVNELREACLQRGLVKNGNKEVLRERLWDWTTEHQMQHQARLRGDFWVGAFENNDPNLFLTEQKRKRKQKRQSSDRGSLEQIDSRDKVTGNKTPNSLAEWSRSIDAKTFTQKRQEIHRQKRIGKKPDTKISDTKNDISKRSQEAATKEYLTKLSNAMKASPSSPYASNKDVKELYNASKKADQLGETSLAMELLESLLELTPNDARLYRRLSRMHNEKGDLNVARATLVKGLKKLPNNPWLWHGMGQLELSRGRNDYAIRCYQRAIQEDPTFAHSYHAWGIHEFNHGQIAKAMNILKKGIEYCPTNHRLHQALGDLYRGAALLKDAERSYQRAIEEGPRVSHSFALSALASVAYEQGDVEKAREWLYKSIETNNGRHAQGWLALAEIEEAEGNVEEALELCEMSIVEYEKGLVEARKNYKKGLKWTEKFQKVRNLSNQKYDSSNFNKRGLVKSIPQYRSGDKFLNVFRHWARLEARYGSRDRCNRVYERASRAFPLDYKISLDWARYNVRIGSLNARKHFVEACSRVSFSNAEPYREYASFEMSLGDYDQARKILFRGAQAVARSPKGCIGKQNQLELARLYVTWAICEWHLGNIPRVEVLFDHALRQTEISSSEGSELRSFVLYCLAQIEYYEREEPHLAQNCISLCLKENSLPGGNEPVWSLWAKIARGLKNDRLEEECLNEANRCKFGAEDSEEEDQDFSALDMMNKLKGSDNIKSLMRQNNERPWQQKLSKIRESQGEDINDSSMSSSSSKFYSSLRLPDFKSHTFRRECSTIEQVEPVLKNEMKNAAEEIL